MGLYSLFGASDGGEETFVLKLILLAVDARLRQYPVWQKIYGGWEQWRNQGIGLFDRLLVFDAGRKLPWNKWGFFKKDSSSSHWPPTETTREERIGRETWRTCNWQHCSRFRSCWLLSIRLTSSPRPSLSFFIFFFFFVLPLFLSLRWPSPILKSGHYKKYRISTPEK